LHRIGYTKKSSRCESNIDFDVYSEACHRFVGMKIESLVHANHAMSLTFNIQCLLQFSDSIVHPIKLSLCSTDQGSWVI